MSIIRWYIHVPQTSLSLISTLEGRLAGLLHNEWVSCKLTDNKRRLQASTLILLIHHRSLMQDCEYIVWSATYTKQFRWKWRLDAVLLSIPNRVHCFCMQRLSTTVVNSIGLLKLTGDKSSTGWGMNVHRTAIGKYWKKKLIKVMQQKYGAT
jgi:hypothetical protein